MRIIHWLAGAAATAVAVGTAYFTERARRGRLARDFLEAVRQGPVEIYSDEPSISAPGQRAAAFNGRVGGRIFAFIAKVDVSGTRWVFGLKWDGLCRFTQDWNPLSGAPEHPLQQAYLLLRRAAKSRDTLN